MQRLRPGVRAGATVTARGDTWSVVGTDAFDAGAFIALEGRGPCNRGRRITLITPFDRIDVPAARRLEWRRRPSALRHALSALGRSRPPGSLWTGVDGDFEVLPWQLSPALAVLAGATRVLLADAVGLGKTLQAGLIAAELAARGLVAHTLILTPPALRDMWAGELGGRLGLDVAVLDPISLGARSRAQGAGTNPWTSAPVVVSSIDFVKRPEVRAAVEAAPIDLLVVDEAHHLTPGSDRAAVVSRFARRVPWFVLASATPHNGDPAAFRALLDLGATGAAGEPPMQVFRRSPADAGLAGRRRSRALAVTPTGAEQALIDGLLAYARAMCRGPFGSRPGVRLVAGILARRAISSAWAAEQSLRRRLDGLTDQPAPAMTAQPALPWDEEDGADGAEGAWLLVPGLPHVSEERHWLGGLIELARAAGRHSSKFHRLHRLITRTRDPAVVFTEFRETLDACRLALAEDVAVACLHGGLDAAERRRALADFLGGRARVLLATDVAGEGLNLQSRARLVVTIEWPWNPQRLEQRIGRVDRLGQTRRVHAVHLTARGTVEDTVVARLLARSSRSRADLASLAAAPAGRTIEAAVLDGTEPGMGTPPASPPSREPEAAHEAARILRERSLAAFHVRAAQASPCWTTPDRPGGAPHVAVLVEVTAAREGRLAWSVVMPVEVQLAAGPRGRREWKRLCQALGGARTVHEAAARAARSTCGGPCPWPAVSARLHAIRRALGAGRTRLVQPSLFDRRAIRDADARAAVLAMLDTHLARTASLVAADRTEPDVETRVVAVVPLGGAPA